MNTTDGSVMKLKIKDLLPKPTPEMAEKARELAEQEAERLGVGIDRIYVVATPWGQMKAMELSDQ